MKARIYVATRTALTLARIEVGPCSRRLACARLPSLLTSPPPATTPLERWKLATLVPNAPFGSLSVTTGTGLSALVGLVHTTSLMRVTRHFSTNTRQTPGTDADKGEKKEPETDLKAIIAKYGAVGAIVYFFLSTALLFSSYFLLLHLGYDTAYLLEQVDRMRALVGLPPSPTDGEPGKEPASENFLTKYIGLDPVILAVAFTVTTPLVPLEVAATVFLARRIVARMGSKAAGKAL